jgi:hypothetical protein
MTGALIQAAAGGSYVELEASYTSKDTDLSSASGQIKFNPNGTITNHNNVQIGQWHYPSGGTPGTGYDIRATPNPDTPDIGTMNTWQALSSTRIWGENRSGSVGEDVAVITVEIRPTGVGAAIDSATVTLRAEIII